MSNKTFSARRFNQDVGGAKRAAAEGPVFITDRGEPSHVLMTIAEYRRLAGNEPSTIELLSMAEDDETEFEPPELRGLPRAAELD